MRRILLFLLLKRRENYYIDLPTGKSVPSLNPSVSLFNSGTTVPSFVAAINLHGPFTTGIQHKVLSTSDTSTTGVPVSKVHKVIPALKS